MKIDRIACLGMISLNLVLPLVANAQLTPQERETLQNGVQFPENPPKVNNSRIFKTPEIRNEIEEGACPGDTPIQKHMRAFRKNNPGKPPMIRDPVTGELEEFKPFTGWKSNGDGTVRLVSEPIVLQDC
ncbi:hypothetical protein [Acaryochloris thomasi]|uniref:hypothetical protein n=1 Tax=Acaryochloris thomasi TaxID=2929456 RepID=UPI0011B72C7A|nr:hypothetical protein [Acaryochloris thomasi]